MIPPLYFPSSSVTLSEIFRYNCDQQAFLRFGIIIKYIARSPHGINTVLFLLLLKTV